MSFMKILQNTFVTSLLIVLSTAALACGHDSLVEHVSLQKSTFLAPDTNFGEFSKTEIAAINAIAEELKLENFKITSRDLSVSHSNQATGMYEVYFGVSLNFTPHDQAFTEFVNKLNANSASQYIYEEDGSCEDEHSH